MNFQDFFIYDETSPSCLRWKIERRSGKNYNQINVRAGDVAGSVGGSGYYSVRYLGKLTLCHEIVAQIHGLFKGEGECIDHVNGDKLDNRLVNLRIIASEKNTRNSKRRSDNTSGIGGVYRLTNKKGEKCSTFWRATWIDMKGKLRNKSFSVTKYGEVEAFELAKAYRYAMIEELNEQGAGYTERHNTLKL